MYNNARLIALALWMLPVVATAEVFDNTVTVERILIDSENFGGCMVEVSPNVNTWASGCGSKWIGFSCDGVYNSKSDAQAKLSAAQLAMVTDGQLYVAVDNARLIDGTTYCFGVRVNNFKAAN